MTTAAPSQEQLLKELEDLRRRLTEQAPRKSEKKYRQLYEGLRDGSAAVNMQGMITEFNPAFQKMLGYTEQEIYALTYTDITPAKWYAHEAAILERQVLTRGYSDIYEKEYRKKDGAVFPVELVTYLIRDEQGNPAGMWAIVRDLTHRKRMESELKLLATAVEAADESVIISDRDGTIRYVNPAFEKLSGYTRDEISGQNFRIFKSNRHDEAFYQNMWRVISSGEVWTGRITNMMKNGTLREFETTISPIRDVSCQIVNFVSVNRDVTQEMTLQAQLLHAQKMEAVGTLAGGVAHDFNNLLQAIQSYAEVLMLENRQNKTDYQILKEICATAKRGGELTQQLLTFSRKVESKQRPLDLNQAVDKARRLLIRTIPKMIDIQLHLEGSLQAINADPNQIGQILMNLGVNARDAMPEGGKLIITTNNVTLDEKFCAIHLGSKPGKYVRLSVFDTGFGMDRETLDHIFEPFYTTKEVGSGTGLGLAMVYGIVKSHDGYITCNSEPNSGSRFDIYFPAIEKKEAQAIPEEE
ncbi:MAG: PAS domain S-box protein, partial [Proteobacteria bacterium]|nr:PAS domain S-box protein [Pseudomonadota bacterium]